MQPLKYTKKLKGVTVFLQEILHYHFLTKTKSLPLQPTTLQQNHDFNDADLRHENEDSVMLLF